MSLVNQSVVLSSSRFSFVSRLYIRCRCTPPWKTDTTFSCHPWTHRLLHSPQWRPASKLPDKEKRRQNMNNQHRWLIASVSRRIISRANSEKTADKDGTMRNRTSGNKHLDRLSSIKLMSILNSIFRLHWISYSTLPSCGYVCASFAFVTFDSSFSDTVVTILNHGYSLNDTVGCSGHSIHRT